jgi:hypothetical protein
VVLWLTALMHSAAVLTEAPDFPGEDGRELTRLMTSYKIQLPGGERSMRELTSGYSWQFAAGLFGVGLMAACAGWPAAGDPAVRRRMAWASCVVLAVFVAIAWK